VAAGLNASIFPHSVLNSASVMSLVQHTADAGVPAAGFAGENGCVHFAASSGMARMLVVVCRSHARMFATRARGCG
jgi:hypothetical protein